MEAVTAVRGFEYDGLEDIFLKEIRFRINYISDKGTVAFDDIEQTSAGVTWDGRWYTGVSIGRY